MTHELAIVSGLDGERGGYLPSALTPAELAAAVREQQPDARLQADLAALLQQAEPAYRINRDTTDLAATGWGVIFPYQIDPSIPDALRPLLAHRAQQAGERYKEFASSRGYRPNDTKLSFLERHGAGPGPVDPDRVPYYLLIVGDPATIPYSFQFALDVQHAVGRIHFDTAEEYARYAASVVAAEQAEAPARPRHAVFFGPRVADDPATLASADKLVRPLAEQIERAVAGGAALAAGRVPRDWAVRALTGDDSTKARLTQLLGGAETPALLFAASHGIGFDSGSARQRDIQGALLCQDWPGPQRHRGPLPDEYLFSGNDISSDAQVHGMIVFAFACYSAGTPLRDSFARKSAATIAPKPFLARLPQRLLAHPRGGALAFIGHVDRTWDYSFSWGQSGSGQVQVFYDALASLLAGQPVGAALDWFNERYAEIAAQLGAELHEIDVNGKLPNERRLAYLGMASSDARNYVVLGDPAVRLSSLAKAHGAAEARDEPRDEQHPAFAVAGSAGRSAAEAPAPAVALAPLLPQEPRTQLEAALAQLGNALAGALDELRGGLAEVEVSTLVRGEEPGAPDRLLMQTRASPSRSALTYTAEAGRAPDPELRALHHEQVERALAQRAALLSSLVETARQVAAALAGLRG